jgi:hypothetical protein
MCRSVFSESTVMFIYYQISHLSPSTLKQALFTYLSPSTQKQPLCLPVMQQSADQTQPVIFSIKQWKYNFVEIINFLLQS